MRKKCIFYKEYIAEYRDDQDKKEKKKVIIKDLLNNREINCNSILEASRWFYNEKITNKEKSATRAIQKSIEEKRTIYGGKYRIILQKNPKYSKGISEIIKDLDQLI